MISKLFSFTAMVLGCLLPWVAIAGESLTGKMPHVPAFPASPASVNLLTGEGVNLGGVIFPHFHANAVYGRTSSQLGHELGAGHHDPVDDGWTGQGFELALSVRLASHFEAFGVYHGFWENESPNAYDGKYEEWFGKIKDLPGGFELRGGRYLNRFGLHNATHLHGWDWADNHLVSGRFLGDDGQYSTGGELSWTLPVDWTSVVSIAYGRAAVEEHEYEEEKGAVESKIEGEGALFADDLLSVNWTNLVQLNDFHQLRYGLSGAWGDNAWARTTSVYGAHLQYEWRANGLERGGDYFRWRTETMFRNVDALTGHLLGEEPEGVEGEEHDDEHGMRESFEDWGLYTTAAYGRSIGSGVIECGMRYDFVRGVNDAALATRHRFSPRVTWYADTLRTGFLRCQYNHDRISGSGSENSVWLSCGINWGGPEVR